MLPFLLTFQRIFKLSKYFTKKFPNFRRPKTKTRRTKLSSTEGLPISLPGISEWSGEESGGVYKEAKLSSFASSSKCCCMFDRWWSWLCFSLSSVTVSFTCSTEVPLNKVSMSAKRKNWCYNLMYTLAKNNPKRISYSNTQVANPQVN